MSVELLTPNYSGSDLPPRYDMSEAEMHDVTHDFLNSQPEEPTSRYMCYNVGQDTAIANVARSVERVVFDESFGNDAEAMSTEYAPYESSSNFLLAIDATKIRPAGVIRAIDYSLAGLKSINDLAEPLGINEETFKQRQGITSLDECVDVGTLAVLPEYRGLDNRFEVSTKLYRSLFLLGEKRGTEHMVTVLDEQALKGLKLLGVPFNTMEGTAVFPYLGSERSYAMYGKFSEFKPAVVARSEELAARGAITVGNILHPKELIKNRIIAKISGSLATGKSIDTAIKL